MVLGCSQHLDNKELGCARRAIRLENTKRHNLLSFLSGLSWCRLVLGERDMQSMTASAKEDVHEASLNAYCIEFRARVTRCLIIQVRRAVAQRRAEKGISCGQLPLPLRLQVLLVEARCCSPGGRQPVVRARASFALLVPHAWSVSSTSYGAAHTAWELMSVGATRSSNSCQMGRRLWMGLRSRATLSRPWTAGLCKGAGFKMPWCLDNACTN